MGNGCDPVFPRLLCFVTSGEEGRENVAGAYIVRIGKFVAPILPWGRLWLWR